MSSSNNDCLTRREVLAKGAAAVALAALSPCKYATPSETSKTDTEERGPYRPKERWRGFNIHDLMGSGYRGVYSEDDFRFVSDWGFNFVRLMVNYRQITVDGDVRKPDQRGLEAVDKGIDCGRKYGLHVSLNLRGAPGHNPLDVTRDNLWKVQAQADGLCALWDRLARRYQDVPPSRLSFNVLNELPNIGKFMSLDDCKRVMGSVTKTIRAVTPGRLIITDGIDWGAAPCTALNSLRLAQSMHVYMPFPVTHYQATWMPRWEDYPKPVWPGLQWKDKTWNRSTLEQFYQPWFDLSEQGVLVHCGEIGVYNKTPHPITMAWATDALDMLSAHQIGFAWWTLRTEFGVLDSGRDDVDYQDFHGHKLDRKLLSLLQKS